MKADRDSPRALVTGGLGPIGTEICLRLAGEGIQVTAVDHPRVVATSQTTSGVDAIGCDLSNAAEVAELVSWFHRDIGSLDFLVNNAAFTGTAALEGFAVPFEHQTDEAFTRALHLNLTVPFSLTRNFAALLQASDRAAIVNVASIYGLVGPDLRLYEGTSMGNPAGYAASKGGLVQLTRYLATVLAPRVRVNCVAPGGVERGQPEEFQRRYADRTPLGRMATINDVAGAVVWLTQADASYVTGQVLAVDGGWTAW